MSFLPNELDGDDLIGARKQEWGAGVPKQVPPFFLLFVVSHVPGPQSACRRARLTGGVGAEARRLVQEPRLDALEPVSRRRSAAPLSRSSRAPMRASEA